MRLSHLVAVMGLITVTALGSLQFRSTCGKMPPAKSAAAAKSTAGPPIAMNNRNDPKALNRQAILLHSQKRYTEAQRLYRQALSLDPNNAAVHNNLAVLLKDMNSLPEAEKEAQIAIGLNHKNADYLFNLGLILQKQGKLAPAQAILARAVRLQPRDPEIRNLLAQVMADRGFTRQASRMARSAEKLRMLGQSPNQSTQ